MRDSVFVSVLVLACLTGSGSAGISYKWHYTNQSSAIFDSKCDDSYGVVYAASDARSLSIKSDQITS